MPYFYWMIEFYSLARKDMKLKEMLDEVERLVSVVLADMFNTDEEWIPVVVCNLHPNYKCFVGIVYTENNVEFIITDVCCDGFREEIDEGIKGIKLQLVDFLK